MVVETRAAGAAVTAAPHQQDGDAVADPDREIVSCRFSLHDA